MAYFTKMQSKHGYTVCLKTTNISGMSTRIIKKLKIQIKNEAKYCGTRLQSTLEAEARESVVQGHL